MANACSLPIIEPEPVLVEFWAAWCPPCRSTLKWLSELKAKYGDRLAVVALAVESPEGGVRSAVPGVGGGLGLGDCRYSHGSVDGITAVPTLFLFDKTGKKDGESRLRSPARFA